MTADRLLDVVNIGPRLAGALHRIGIHDGDELRSHDAIEIWERLRSASEFDCVNSLLALTGAIAGVRWHDLPEHQRKALSDHVRRSAR